MFKVRDNRKVRSQTFMQMQSVELEEFNATGHQQTETLQVVPVLTQRTVKSSSEFVPHNVESKG